ncbi:tRNA1(Val) (adenine(37)-N6)-methyltransferase [Brevundimonas subvibrioides]|uniref:Methyltransferase small n=1 Tax=Brevundimonas subvibrioides (strain ATCC 15264 / DSM 4735 / LMG 14903 / NBRC 16000 / CB 81) TaxID=633149 RepID=D9QK29_BRESC|nr:methyltransferase [Brevundimonas subvibrioides]ADL01614.1 methyltransferase small [Brevundimonas subvibrioides ATCC 15264]
MTVASPPPEAALPVENALLGGKVRLLQAADGYRAGMDAALLAAAVVAKPGERVLEAGCGVGAVLTQIAARRPGVVVTGVERDPAAVALGACNVGLNALQDRMAVVQADVAGGFAALGRERFDWAVSNPPFFDDEAALRAPSPAKRGAWIADDGLAVWIRFLSDGARDGGRIVVIHRADRLADLLALLGERCGSFAIRPIQPFADQAAKRVLVQAVRGGKAPLRLLPALVLHDRSGAKHAPEAEAILRGETGLGF